MKKWTKVLSAFVVATVMSAGMAAAVGCDGCGEEEHKHTYKTEWVPGTNGHWHESDCGHDNSATEPHVDEINNDTKEATPDGLCDVCGYQMQVPTPPAEEKVTVSFVTGEGATTVAEQKIDKGGKATEPTAPTKPDHTFGGWFIDADCTEGNEFDFDTAISADLPLYAKWTANGENPPVVDPPVDEKVTVTFVTGEGATTVAEQKIDKGGKATEPTAPTKADHTFGGWFTDAACTEGNEFDFDTEINADLPLYAKWTANGENPPVQNHLYEISAANSEAGTKLEAYADGARYGLYAEHKTETDYFSATANGFAQTLGTAGNKGAYISFGMLKGDIEGSFEVTPSLMGTKWDMIQFRSGTSNVFAVRTFEDKNNPNIFSYKLNGTVAAAENAVNAAENTKYTVEYSLVVGAGGNHKLTLKINGTAFVTDLELGKTIDCIYMISSNGGSDVTKARLLTIDNVIIDGTVMTVDDYRTAAQAEIDAAYVKMVGKAAVGTEGEEGYVPAVVGTHSRNAAAIQSAYAVIDLSVISEITEIKTKVAEFTALSASVESDAKIAAAIAKYSADLADVKTNQAANYTVNKTAFDALIAKYEAVDFSTAKTVATVTAKYAQFEVELAAILTDAQETAKALLEAKTAAKATVNGTTAPNGASQSVIDRIAELKAAALEDIEGAVTEAELQAIMTEFETDVESALRLDNLPLYQAGEVTNLKNYAKAITDTLDVEKDATLISAINGAVGDGETAINAAQDTAGVDAAKIAAETAIDKLVAKDTLAKYAATKKAAIESKGEYAVITAIKDAIDGFVTSGSTAIDASAVKDDDHNYVNGALEAAKANIDTEFEKVNSVKFTITISGVENVTAEQVAYGQKVVVDTSRLADNVMVKGWYTDAAKHNAFDFNTPIYDDITLYAETAESIKFDAVTNKFTYNNLAAPYGLDKNKAEYNAETNPVVGGDKSPLTAGAMKGDGNSFITIVGTEGELSQYVTWRKSNNCIENKDGGLTVYFANPGTLTISFASTNDKGNKSRLGLKGEDNEWIVATTVGSPATLVSNATESVENGTYEVAGTTAATVVFTITKAGTYTIICPSAELGRGARVSKIEQVIDAYKVECDVTATFGNATNKYYHDQTITVPEDPKTGNGEFVGWYKKGTDEKFEGGKLAAGSYEFEARYEYTVKITYNNGTENVDLYLNVSEGSGIEAKLPTLPAQGNQIHAGWKIGNDGEKIVDYSTVQVGTAAEPKEYTFVAVYEESSAKLVESITITAAENKTSVAATGTLQLTATVNPTDADDTSVTWSSSDNSLATVSETGLVTAKNKEKVAKTVTITATANDASGVTKDFELTIEAAPNAKSALTYMKDVSMSSNAHPNLAVKSEDNTTLATLASADTTNDNYRYKSDTTFAGKVGTDQTAVNGWISSKSASKFKLSAGDDAILVTVYLAICDSSKPVSKVINIYQADGTTKVATKNSTAGTDASNVPVTEVTLLLKANETLIYEGLSNKTVIFAVSATTDMTNVSNAWNYVAS